MQRKIGVLRTTVVGGILFLAPLVATVFIVEKALGLASKLLQPILGHFPHKLLGFVAVSDLLAIVLLVVICFIAGLLARTVLARRLISTIEQRLLSNLPGYEFFKGLGESILGADGAANRQPVMVRFDDCHQLGFLMEHLDDGTCVVFLPGAPIRIPVACSTSAPIACSRSRHHRRPR
ncbi:DUF502 domain-containing protein [Uliginosibacterium sp. H1]|uniref:DUF502 domain-containing protein n=1 Tax=Uliginosibacterium sp. H1 TaxID=3114757 RepID=UPI002E189348|nr:DUF502 domain-containing protein [Uliginosibacterium sp. H1]